MIFYLPWFFTVPRGQRWQENTAVLLHVDLLFLVKLPREYTKCDLFIPWPVKGVSQVKMDAGSVLTEEIWHIQREGRGVRRSGFFSCKSFFFVPHLSVIKPPQKHFFTCLVLLMGRGKCIKYISEGNLISHRSNRLFCLRFSIFQRRKIKHSFLPLSFFLISILIEEQEDGGGGNQKHACLVDKHPSFPKQQLWNAGTGIPQLQLERHKASLWDLFLAFAMALMKYFINNVNVLDGGEKRRQSFYMHCHSNKMFRLYLFRARDS